MCLGCLEKITAGMRHIWEYVPFPGEVWLLDSPKDIEKTTYEKMWVQANTSLDGCKVEVTRSLLPCCDLCSITFKGPKSAGNAAFRSFRARAESSFAKNEIIRLKKAYKPSELRLEELFRIRHPLNQSVPYFRQIWPYKDYLLIANNFSSPRSGMIKARGTPETLSGILRTMLGIQLQKKRDWKRDAKGFARGSDYVIGDETQFCRLLESKGIIKVMGSYVFVVTKNEILEKGEGWGESFCFTDDIEMVVNSVKEKLMHLGKV